MRTDPHEERQKPSLMRTDPHNERHYTYRVPSFALKLGASVALSAQLRQLRLQLAHVTLRDASPLFRGLLTKKRFLA